MTQQSGRDPEGSDTSTGNEHPYRFGARDDVPVWDVR
jgi:hypothetical protein